MIFEMLTIFTGISILSIDFLKAPLRGTGRDFSGVRANCNNPLS
jgi:hypothetical protein